MRWILLGARALRACQDAAVAAGVWAVASIGGLITSAAVILGIPLSHLAEHASAAGELNQVRALAVAVVLTALLAIVLSGCRTVRGARLALAKLIGAFRVSLADNTPVIPTGVVTTQPDRAPKFVIKPR